MLSCGFVLCAVIFSASAQAGSGYCVIKKIPIPGQGSWDYLTVDEGARRLYVSHGSQVEVLDIDSGKMVGQVSDTPGVHGIAVAPELGRGFVSDGQASKVTVFELKTLKPLQEISTGKKPDAIIYDPATKRVFAFNGDSGTATVIDAASGEAAGSVDLGGGPGQDIAAELAAPAQHQAAARQLQQDRLEELARRIGAGGDFAGGELRLLGPGQFDQGPQGIAGFLRQHPYRIRGGEGCGKPSAPERGQEKRTPVFRPRPALTLRFESEIQRSDDPPDPIAPPGAGRSATFLLRRRTIWPCTSRGRR